MEALASALVMQVLALALKKRSWPWPRSKAKAKTFLKLEKSLEHFQIIGTDFVWCYRTMCVQQQISARLLIIFTSPLAACHSQQVRTLKNHNKLQIANLDNNCKTADIQARIESSKTNQHYTQC